MSAKAIVKTSFIFVSTLLTAAQSGADTIDDVSPIVAELGPIISLADEMNIKGALGSSLKALDPVSSVLQMEIESRQPSYRNAPHVVYARGLTDFVVGKPIYAAAGAFVSAACVSDPASCGIVASAVLNKAQAMVDASKDSVEHRVRAFDDYGLQAARREDARRANGETSLDDYPPIRDAHRTMANFSERLLEVLEMDAENPLDEEETSQDNNEDNKNTKWKMLSGTMRQLGEETPMDDISQECIERGTSDAFELVAKAINIQGHEGANCYSSKVIADTKEYVAVSQQCVMQGWGNTEYISTARAMDEKTVGFGTIYIVDGGQKIEMFTVVERCD